METDEIIYCTGFEGRKGLCEWCGEKVRPGRKFCPDGHRDLYYKYFLWTFARPWALERAYYRCQRCGVTGLQAYKQKEDENTYRFVPSGLRLFTYIEYPWGKKQRTHWKEGVFLPYIRMDDYLLEVHHITPLEGNRTERSPLHAPWNLFVACHLCHLVMADELRNGFKLYYQPKLSGII